MPNVVCWCCQHYKTDAETEPDLRIGMCLQKIRVCLAFSEVCQDFLLTKGLYTKRIIPDHCKNYR